MLIKKFKPVGNLVLLKTVYRARGIVLNTNNQKNVALKVLDKTVVAIGPDVTRANVGDIVCMKEQPFNLEIVQFADNPNDMIKVREAVNKAVKAHNAKSNIIPDTMRMAHNAANPINQEWETVGYVVVPESEIIGICNSVNEDPEIDEEPKAIIPV